MNVKIIVGTDSDGWETDEMEINGKSVLSVYPLNECPEDAYIERDLVCCRDVLSYMQMAYKAGKNGEELNIETIEEEE